MNGREFRFGQVMKRQEQKKETRYEKEKDIQIIRELSC